MSKLIVIPCSRAALHASRETAAAEAESAGVMPDQ